MGKRVNVIFVSGFLIILMVGLLVPLHVIYGAESGEASLVFHMALSNQKIAEVHATVENTGSTPIERGYIVVSSHDEQCNSRGDVLQAFSHIPVGGRIPLVVPLPGGASGYLVTSFQAFDDFGFPMVSHDDTAEIIKGRFVGMRRECERNREIEK